MDDAKNWYESKTIWGGVIAVLASCAQLFGIDILPADQVGLADGLTAIAAASGGILTIWGRISARTRLR